VTNSDGHFKQINNLQRLVSNSGAQRNAQAVIPPRKNAQTWKATLVGAHARNEALRACDRLGRSIWSGYHRRSLVETKMHCFKRLGQRVMARSFERQVVELHVRVALLNRSPSSGAQQRCLCLP
jgi:hypothetical protein